MSGKLYEHYLEVEKPCLHGKKQEIVFFQKHIAFDTKRCEGPFQNPKFTGLEGFRASLAQAHTLVLQ